MKYQSSSIHYIFIFFPVNKVIPKIAHDNVMHDVKVSWLCAVLSNSFAIGSSDTVYRLMHFALYC